MTSSAATTPQARLSAIDWMRGLVMLLMTSDHAAAFFYADRIAADGVIMPGWSEPLAAVPFLHRWLSHLCAPTFVFLAGASIALSAVRRRAEGRGVARDLAIRGALLIAIDIVLMSPAMAWPEGFWLLFQVLFAIGAGMLAMAVLHRLPGSVCFALGLGIVVGHEMLARVFTEGYAESAGGAAAVLVTGGFVYPWVMAVYPALPWLGVILLGYGYGVRLVRAGRIEPGPLVVGGALALSAWLVVEWADGYGNCGVLRVDDSWLRWLQVSKYPPSLGFVGLELGLMAWVLALRQAYENRRGAALRQHGPLLLLGRTALCYYLLHITLLTAVGLAPWLWWGLWTREQAQGGLAWVWLWVVITVVVSLPVCRMFLAAKLARPRSWRRWI